MEISKWDKNESCTYLTTIKQLKKNTERLGELQSIAYLLVDRFIEGKNPVGRK